MNLAKELRDTVLGEYEQAKNLVFPMFPIKVNDKIIHSPNLMQRMVVLSLLHKKNLGNWSDMGTGKTLAAVLSAYAIHAKLTIICCPNSVKEEWEFHINGVFTNAKVLYSIRNVVITSDNEVFIIANYEQFQQSWSKSAVDSLAKKYKVDFLIFDEIHQAKQKNEHTSKRRGILMHMRKILEIDNDKLYVIGQTGTPCINETMREPISQLELISGKEHSDLPTSISIPNIFRIRQPMMLTGIRCPSNFEKRFPPIITEINCNNRLNDLLAVKTSILGLDQILMEEKTPFILNNLKHKEKTIIYVNFVNKLVTKLQLAVQRAGFKVDTYTGVDTEYTRSKVKCKFINGDTEVLIASKPISIGVDGLQNVCHKMIIPILPWTGAEYRQLVCRLERTGQNNNVTIIIPQAFIEVNGNRWSLDAVRWHRILHKQTIGDMLMAAAIPDEVHLSYQKVKTACLRWFNRVASGKIHDDQREDIVVEFTGEDAGRNNNFGELHKMHTRLNRMHSSKSNEDFNNKQYFATYHQLYNAISEKWDIIPREVIADWCEKEEVIGDFGCGGKCHIAKLLPKNTVYSYDHNSLDDEDVICCDIANIPLEDEKLNVVIFSLSLMGCNYKDYFAEAHRCLHTDGKLYIAELTNHRLVKTLPSDLKEIGFKINSEERYDKFTFIKAVKQ